MHNTVLKAIVTALVAAQACQGQVQIELTVLGPNEAPQRNVEVWLIPNTGAHDRARTDGEGTVRFVLKPTAYVRILITHPDFENLPLMSGRFDQRTSLYWTGTRKTGQRSSDRLRELFAALERLYRNRPLPATLPEELRQQNFRERIIQATPEAENDEDVAKERVALQEQLERFLGSSLVPYYTLPVHNGTDMLVDVWIRRPTEKVWQPPVSVGPQQASELRFNEEGRYYVVATTRGPDSREYPLGVFNFRRLKERLPDAAIHIYSRMVTEQREVQHEILEPVYETQIEEHTEMVWVCVDGRWIMIPEPRTRTREVIRHVPRTVVRTETHTVPELSATPWSRAAPIISQVEFRTQPEGAFIRYHLAGKPQVRISKNPTNSTEPLAIGTYIVWAERDGVQTSDKYAYDIYSQAETITIPERSRQPVSRP